MNKVYVMRIQFRYLLFLILFSLCIQELSGSDLYLDPVGAQGRLVIVGHGEIPRQARGQFVQWAGGSAAKIVIVTTASADAGTDKQNRFKQTWSDLTLSHCYTLNPENRQMKRLQLKYNKRPVFGFVEEVGSGLSMSMLVLNLKMN